MSVAFRVVGIDPSLTSTGLARATFYDNPAEDPVSTATHWVTGTLEAKANSWQQWRRMDHRAGEAAEFAKGADLVLIEGPAFDSRFGLVHERAGLWWMIWDRLAATVNHVAVVPPATLKIAATGHGNATKSLVTQQVTREQAGRFEIPDTSAASDVCDAIALVVLGAHAFGHHLGPWPPERARALTAVTWPARLTPPVRQQISDAIGKDGSK